MSQRVRQEWGKILQAAGMAALLAVTLACSGLSGGPNAAAPSGGALDAPQAVPGAPAGETATKFDPDDVRDYGFVETEHQFAREGSGYATRFQGHVRHLEKTPTSGGKFDAVPCCEGRWLLVRDTLHQTCAAAAIGSGGTWAASIPAGDPLLPEFLFYLGNVGFSPASGINNDCSNYVADNWSKFPIGYVPAPRPAGPASFAPDNDSAASNGILHPANSGVRGLDNTTLPVLDDSWFSQHYHLQYPGNSDDSDP